MTETGFEELLKKCKENEIEATPGLNYETRKPDVYYIKNLSPDSAMAKEIEEDGYMLLYSLPPASTRRELEKDYEEGKNFAMVVDPRAPKHPLSLADKIYDHLSRCHHTHYFVDRAKKDSTLWMIPTQELLEKFEGVLKQLGYPTSVERNTEKVEDPFIFLTARGEDPAKTVEMKDMQKIYGKNMAKIPAFLEKLASIVGLAKQPEQEVGTVIEGSNNLVDLLKQSMDEMGE